jgi:phage terminase large subunit
MRPLSPVKGSVFTKLPQPTKELLVYNGAVPVNDIFFDLWDYSGKILLLYGGYGSGKSVFAVDKLIKHCLRPEYFRCFYGRKVFDTVRVSVFATLCDRIEELGLQNKFIYSRADNSSMIIRCRDNENTFTPFGADNINKLKSVKDPTHIFCEELDQFSERDFGVLVSRLRTIKSATQFIGAFNTDKVTYLHWLYLAFFSEDSEKRKGYANYVIKKVFCNYNHNNFIDQKEYEQTLWLSAGFNETTFNEIASGEWGTNKAGSPFIFNFDRKKHIVKGLQEIPHIPIILSFDFNTEPITCLVGQCDRLDRVRILDEYRLMNSDIDELCQRILADYPDKMLLVTGDASGQNRTALKRDLNYYKEIKRQLTPESRTLAYFAMLY